MNICGLIYNLNCATIDIHSPALLLNACTQLSALQYITIRFYGSSSAICACTVQDLDTVLFMFRSFIFIWAPAENYIIIFTILFIIKKKNKLTRECKMSYYIRFSIIFGVKQVFCCNAVNV